MSLHSSCHAALPSTYLLESLTLGDTALLDAPVGGIWKYEVVCLRVHSDPVQLAMAGQRMKVSFHMVSVTAPRLWECMMASGDTGYTEWYIRRKGNWKTGILHLSQARQSLNVISHDK